MFRKPSYAYTSFVFSVPINDEAIPQWREYGFAPIIPTSWVGKSYRIDFGLYPIGEGRFQIGTGFGEYQGSNEIYESFNVKALHFPIYVAFGTKEVIARASPPPLLFGINTSYWHSVSKKLNTNNFICCDLENYDKFQDSGFIFIASKTTDNGDSYSVQVSQNYLNFEGGNDLQRVGETTVGFGYYFK